jgi:hypothetical protein
MQVRLRTGCTSEYGTVREVLQAVYITVSPCILMYIPCCIYQTDKSPGSNIGAFCIRALSGCRAFPCVKHSAVYNTADDFSVAAHYIIRLEYRGNNSICRSILKQPAQSLSAKFKKRFSAQQSGKRPAVSSKVFRLQSRTRTGFIQCICSRPG